MRIECPFCGAREQAEFTYLGAAQRRRPDIGAPDADVQFFEATYLRDNHAGIHREFWYHALGCRSCVRVTRDTRTHEVIGVVLAAGVGNQ
jgi:methylglutamate dehydrogenase subunit B